MDSREFVVRMKKGSLVSPFSARWHSRCQYTTLSRSEEDVPGKSGRKVFMFAWQQWVIARTGNTPVTGVPMT